MTQTKLQLNYESKRAVMSGNGQPYFVLIRPQMGENIGASARAMWNFGLDQLRLVAPRDGWPNSRASALATGAGRLLDLAQDFISTPAAIADCHFVFATTARNRQVKLPIFSPKASVQEASKRLASGERIAFLFGPERTGLENSEIIRANAIISIPTNIAFPSLNLSHAVSLLAYEWAQEIDNQEIQDEELTAAPSATHHEREILAQHYEECLEAADFFFPSEKANNMKVTLRALWSRLPLTTTDIEIFHGILRQLTGNRKQERQINMSVTNSPTVKQVRENDQ